MRAIHEVEHHVFKLWHERFLVYLVEVDLLVRCDLESNVTFNEKDITAHLFESMVILPLAGLRINLEEED